MAWNAYGKVFAQAIMLGSAPDCACVAVVQAVTIVSINTPSTDPDLSGNRILTGRLRFVLAATLEPRGSSGPPLMLQTH